MAKGNSNVKPASNSDWDDDVLKVVGRLGPAHKPFARETVAIVASTPGCDRTESNPSVLETIRTPPLSRTVAVWILVGALWISIGMIVSATVVTVAFLA